MAAGIVAPFKVMAVQVTIYLTEGDSGIIVRCIWKF